MFKQVLVGSFILASVNTWAHGGNKPGPHGGKVMMPGNFHTELVMKDSEIHIYLLDMKFEKPTVKNSNVVVSIEHHGKEETLTCKPKDTFFLCNFKGPMSMISKVKVAAQREKAKGTANYDFKSVAAVDPHAGH